MKELVNVILVNFFLIEEASLPFERVTGIFGPNGSGKSSVLDAIQIAMMGANGNQISLNAQADDKSVRRSPRRIRDYVLGRFGVEEGEEARESAITYITLVFKDTQSHEPLSLGVCLSAQRGKDDHETLGRYVLPGVQLALNDHVSRQGDDTVPLDWAAFQMELEKKAKVSGASEVVFSDSDRFGRAYLLALRSSDGQPQLEGFRKAFRFALRMRFDQSVEEIVKNQVLEARPVDIKKFREVLNSFGQLRNLVAKIEEKIKGARAVKQHYDRARAELRKASTWKALAADAMSDLANGEQDRAMGALDDARGRHDRIQGEVERLTSDRLLASEDAQRLQALISGHAAHERQGTATIQLQEKEAALGKAKSGFHQGTLYAARMLETAAASGHLPELAASLRAEAESLEQWLLNDSQDSTREAAAHALYKPVAALSGAFSGLSGVLSAMNQSKLELEARIQRQHGNLERARTGRAALDDDVIDMQAALSDAGIRTEPVCDLVRVSDTEWQPAIESYLGRNRQALVIFESEQEQEAFDIYRSRKRTYGVKLVLASQNRDLHTPARGTVAELLVGDTVPAVAYLRSLFGSMQRATDSRAVKQLRALTSDGMLVSSGALERKRPVDALLLGGGRANPERATQFARDIEAAKRDLDLLARRIGEVKTLQGRLGLFSDAAQGLETILASFDTLRVAQADVQALRLMLAASANEEYSSLVEEQRQSQERASALEQDLGARQKDLGAAFERINGLERALQTSAEKADQARLHAESLRRDPYFDSETSLSGWDQLLREFDGRLEGMAEKAT
jgi:chromosome segregation ATPase